MPDLRPAPCSSPSRLARLLALAGCVGCAARAALDDSSFPISPPWTDPCQPRFELVAHVDEPTSLGFSAMDVLARLAGPRSSPGEWIEPPASDEYILDYGPERGSSSLDLDVRVRDGRILVRQLAPRYDAPPDTTCGPDTLEIPVEVGLRSSGLALDERFDAMLVASVPYQARISQQLVPRALRGGLSFSRVLSLDSERSFWIRSLGLEALLWEGGSMGNIAVQLGASYTREVQDFRPLPTPATPAPELLGWPPTSVCGAGARYLPSDARVLGFSVSDVLAKLALPTTRLPTWSDGAVVPLALEIEAPEADLCQQLGESLRFTAMLRARSEDLSLDVRLPVQIEAEGDGGNLGAISIESSEPDAPHPIARELNRGAAPRPRLHFDGYRALLVALDWTRLGERDSGVLAVRGVESAEPDAEGHYSSSLLTDGHW